MKSKLKSKKKSNIDKPFVTDKKAVSDYLESNIKRVGRKIESIIEKPVKVILQDKDQQVPKQQAEVCQCCKNDCKCCTHPAGTVGHRCLCRCHA